MSKRKRVVLTFQQKLEILKKLDEGERGAILAKQYGIGTSTISDIRRNGDAILKFVSSLDCENLVSEKKTRKTAQNVDLDSLIYRWYLEEKEKGEVPTDGLICSKALEINKQLSNQNQGFKASAGWLRHFKNRHGIKDKEPKEDEPKDVQVAKKIKNLIKRKGYLQENVYNVFDDVLQWKSLPNHSRVTSIVKVIACANAIGSHKLPLYIIGTEGVETDLVIYKHQTPDLSFFKEWFDEVFVPQVTQRQQHLGYVGKVLLIMGGSCCYPPIDTLIEDRENLEIFIVPEDSLLVQPMEQQMNHLKNSYRKQLLEVLQSKPCPLKQFLEDFSLTEAISLLSKGWSFISRSDIVQFWTRLLSDVKNEVEPYPGLEEIVQSAKKIPGLEDIDSINITNWLESDKDFSYNSFQLDDPLESQESEVSEEPTNIEAYQCLETAVQWFRKQEECNSAQLTTLESLRDLAATKICGKIKQEVI